MAPSTRPWLDPRLAAAAAAFAVGVFAVVVGAHLGGPGVSDTVDEVGSVVASLLAAVACALAARMAGGFARLAWSLLASSAGAWFLGQSIHVGYEWIAGSELPFPSLPDLAILAAPPLAVAGVLALPAAPGAPPRNWRYWLDAAIIATAFFFVSWAVGLGTVVHALTGGLVTGAASLALPIGDIVVTTVLMLAIGRASYQQRDKVFLLLAGIAAITVSDFGFKVSVLDTGWFAGYILVAFAAQLPANEVGKGGWAAPIDVRQLVLPWFVVLLAGITTVMLALTGQQLDSMLTVLAGILFVLLMLSQVAAHRESLALLVKSLRAEANLANVIERAPIGIARIEADMTVTDANPRFAALLNRSVGSKATLRVADFIGPVEVDRMSSTLRELSSESGSVEGDSEATRGDGSNAWLHWNVARGNGEGEDRYYIAMFEDVTAARAASEAAAANLIALEHMNELKSDFLATFRHEFKTALVGIQGFSELMSADEVSPDEVKSYAKEILNDAQRLDRMIKELMDLDQVEKGRAAMSVDVLDLNQLITRVVSAIRAEGIRNVIALDLDPKTPAIAGDQERLENLLRALIGNAAQYSPRSGRIVVATARVPGFAQAVVKDQGLGARGDFQDRMFGSKDLYAGSPLRKVIGTELGLAMARHVVEMHGGRIWVERMEGIGSEVYFTIPERVGGAGIPPDGAP
jgi:signal transduction histidine kinase